MVFAGEVFPEWYWGPIFFMVVFVLAYVDSLRPVAPHDIDFKKG